MATASGGQQPSWELSAPVGRRTVLFVAPVHQWPSDVLLRAEGVARRLSADLFVLRMTSAGFAQALPVAPATTDTRHWCERILAVPFSEKRIFVAAGRLVPATAKAARLTSADLVVLPPGQEDAATRLARRARVPVLLARPWHTGAALVTATDLDDVSDTVVRYGAELAERLSEPVVFVHNVGPVLVPTPTGDIATTLSVPPSAAMVSARREQLLRLAHEHGHDGATMVETRPSTADGVLDAARTCCADLIVVGTHQRSWLGRMLQFSAAQELCQRSPQSVLVVPLPEHHAG